MQLATGMRGLRRAATEALERPRKRALPMNVPSLTEFMASAQRPNRQRPKIWPATETAPQDVFGILQGARYSIETYGCQMNEEDSGIVEAVLKSAGLTQMPSTGSGSADVYLVNTCAIREHAEEKVFDRLRNLRNVKNKVKLEERPVIAVLGCMAERLKDRLLAGDASTSRLADVVVGPDSYRDLPRLIAAVRGGLSDSAMNVQLSLEETYADISPVREATSQGGAAVEAFLSIMRGCNNVCSFCVVPHTRGRERSRPVGSIEDEVSRLVSSGFKEVTLLGQNVNSYCDATTQAGGVYVGKGYISAEGFSNMYKARDGDGVRFTELLDRLSVAHPEVRFRFTSAHPKDFPDDLLQLIAERPNLAKQLHLPAQAGSDAVLSRMRRGYSVSAYESLASHARSVIPGVALSSDFIAGFCEETEEDHQGTLALMTRVKYEQAFMFAYSKRERTHAAYTYEDDVAQEVKGRRLAEIVATFRAGAQERNKEEVGKVHLVLWEGPSKRHKPGSDAHAPGSEWTGRTCTNKRVMMGSNTAALDLQQYVQAGGNGSASDTGPTVPLQPGDFVAVRVTGAGVTTLLAQPLARTTIRDFERLKCSLR